MSALLIATGVGLLWLMLFGLFAFCEGATFREAAGVASLLIFGLPAIGGIVAFAVWLIMRGAGL